MTWASMRRFVYGLGVLLFFSALVAPFVYMYVTRPATCGDGIKNQGETAIDKGGPCTIRDEAELKPVTVRFASAFPVAPGVYSAVGYIENPNKEVGTQYARYRFSLFNAEGIQIGERDGSVFIPPQTTLPVFEALIKTGNQVVARTTLVFEPVTDWVYMREYVSDLRAANIKRSDLQREPRITADIYNDGLEYVRNIPVVVTVYDETGTVRAASRTTIDAIAKGTSKRATFTWPNPFAFLVSRIDVVPIALPESLKRL